MYVKDALKRIPGVGDVIIFGERKYAMRIWLDPTKLASRQLTAADVVTALQEQNVEIPAGQLGRPPADLKQSYQATLRVEGRLSEPKEFESIVLKRSPNGIVKDDAQPLEFGRARAPTAIWSTSFRPARSGAHQVAHRGATRRRAGQTLIKPLPVCSPHIRLTAGFNFLQSQSCPLK